MPSYRLDSEMYIGGPAERSWPLLFRLREEFECLVIVEQP